MELSKKGEEGMKRMHEIALAEVKVKQKEAKCAAVKKTAMVKAAAKVQEQKDSKMLKIKGAKLRHDPQDKVSWHKAFRERAGRKRQQERAYAHINQAKQNIHLLQCPGWLAICQHGLISRQCTSSSQCISSRCISSRQCISSQGRCMDSILIQHLTLF